MVLGGQGIRPPNKLVRGGSQCLSVLGSAGGSPCSGQQPLGLRTPRDSRAPRGGSTGHKAAFGRHHRTAAVAVGVPHSRHLLGFDAVTGSGASRTSLQVSWATAPPAEYSPALRTEESHGEAGHSQLPTSRSLCNPRPSLRAGPRLRGASNQQVFLRHTPGEKDPRSYTKSSDWRGSRVF